MIRSLYTAVSGLITQEAKQEVITSNLSNANTIGYKGYNLATKKFDDVMIQNYDKKVLGKNVKNEIGSLSFGSKIDETATYFSQGIFQETDRETDFAIEGNGFFTVNKNGTDYFTRDGHFQVDLQGYLVNDSGDRVQGKNASTGAVEPINVGSGKISTDSKGGLYVNGSKTYDFQIADFGDYKSLTRMGENLYKGSNPTYDNNVFIKQKTLEKSNVNVMNEMVNMMTVMRQFETNQKMVQMVDESLGKAANELGTVR